MEYRSNRKLALYVLFYTVLALLCQYTLNLAIYELESSTIIEVSANRAAVYLIQFVLSAILGVGLFLVLARGLGTHGADERFRIAMDLATRGFALVGPSGNIDYANTSFSRSLRLTESVEGQVNLASLVKPNLAGDDIGAFYPRPGEGERHHHIILRDRSSPLTHIDIRLRALPQGLGWLATLDSSVDWFVGRQDDLANVAADISMNAVLVVDVVDPAFPIIYANPAFQQMTGYELSSLPGTSVRVLESRDDGELDPQVFAALEGGNPTSATVRLSRKDGSTFLGDIHVAPVKPARAAQGQKPRYAVAIIQDLTALRDLKSELERHRSYDQVTSLPNRARFKEVLLSLSQSATGPLVIALISIRRFTDIIAAHGDDFGNLVLVQIAARLSALSGAFVARTASDQFALALPSEKAEEAAVRVDEITTTLGAAYVVPGSIVSLFFSIGYTVSQPGADPETLLRQAVAALWSSADLAAGKPQRFDGVIDLAIRQRLELTRDLQGALSQGEFEISYEPRFDLSTEEIVGAEASLRWNHPVFGTQLPARFMPIAEESGLILEIGAWAIGEVGKFAASLNKARIPPLHFGVKLAPVQISDYNLVEKLESAMARAEAVPSWMTLEIPSAISTAVSRDLHATFEQIRARGFGLALVDFEAASISLGRLDSLPVTSVTIDQKFTKDVRLHEYRQTVISSVVRICQHQGIAVTAEGVESQQDCTLLHQLGCRTAQGPLFSRPLSGAMFQRFLDEKRPPPGLRPFPIISEDQ